jgi:hypothetical protein
LAETIGIHQCAKDFHRGSITNGGDETDQETGVAAMHFPQPVRPND